MMSQMNLTAVSFIDLQSSPVILFADNSVQFIGIKLFEKTNWKYNLKMMLLFFFIFQNFWVNYGFFWVKTTLLH